MASTLYTLLPTWDANNKYTAGSNVDVIVSNTGEGTPVFEVTQSDDLPVITEKAGHPIPKDHPHAIQLNSGDRLWFAGAYGKVTVGV